MSSTTAQLVANVTSDSRPQRPSSFWAAYAGVAFLLLIPLLTVRYPPLADYPRHLARCYVIGNLPNSAQLQQHYEYQPGPYPNLAVDFTLPLLANFVNYPLAGKLYVAAYVILLPLAIIFLSGTAERTAAWSSLLAAFLVFNFHFLAGFLNYCAGVVLFFLALGMWVRWRAALTPLRMVLLAAVFATVYFAHIIGIVALFVSIAVYEFTGKDRWQNLSRLAVIASPTIVAGVWWWSVSLSSSASGVGTIRFSVMEKFRAALGPIRTYGTLPDIVLLAALLLLLVACWRRPIIRDNRLLWAGIALTAIFVFGPRASATGTSADDRFLLPAAGVMLASVELRPRWPKFWVVALTLMLLGRTAWITYHWRSFDESLRQQSAGLTLLAPGARVYPLVYEPMGWSLRTEPDLHFYLYAVIDRQIYAPSLPADQAQQGLRNVSGEFVTSNFSGFERQPESSKFQGYDYLWTLRAGRFDDVLSMHGELILKSGELRIYRLRSSPPMKSVVPTP